MAPLVGLAVSVQSSVELKSSGGAAWQASWSGGVVGSCAHWLRAVIAYSANPRVLWVWPGTPIVYAIGSLAAWASASVVG